MTRTCMVVYTLLVLLFGVTTVSAAPLTWDNGGGDMLWNNGTNWNPNQPGIPGAANMVSAISTWST